MRYLRWLVRLLLFPVRYTWALVVANVTVGRDVLTPGSAISGGFVEVPLRCRTDFEITTLANMVTLTPGTATVAVHPASSTMWVQGLYMADPADLREDVWKLEDLLLGATRVTIPPAAHPPVGHWREKEQQ